MLRWALIVAAVGLVTLAAVSLAFGLRARDRASSTSAPYVAFEAGERPAPPIELQAATGAPFSLSSLRGRTVIVTFTDPHCRTFCPRESFVIDDALRALPAARRPAVVAVSVDPTVQSARVLARQATRFKWLPQWRWAKGSHAALAKVWRAYGVTVVPTKGDIAHTELAYVVDARGDERSLLLWPFRARDLSRALAAASS